jgi:hypothetical protein
MSFKPERRAPVHARGYKRTAYAGSAVNLDDVPLPPKLLRCGKRMGNENLVPKARLLRTCTFSSVWLNFSKTTTLIFNWNFQKQTTDLAGRYGYVQTTNNAGFLSQTVRSTQRGISPQPPIYKVVITVYRAVHLLNLLQQQPTWLTFSSVTHLDGMTLMTSI